jgi:hypothetical protein
VLAPGDPRGRAEDSLAGGAADALFAGLIPLLREGVAQAIAEGVNTDAGQATADSMIKSLLVASDAEVVAAAVNDNPDFVAGLLVRLNETAARAVAEGLNANPDTTRVVARYLDANTGRRIAEALNLNPAIIKPLLENLSPDVGKAIAEGLNQSTEKLDTNHNGIFEDTEVESSLAYQLMSNLDPEVGEYIARGLNAHVAANPHDNLVTNLLPNLDGNVGKEVAAGLNANAANPDLSRSFLEAMLGATSKEFAGVIASVINSAPFNMDSFLSQLIRNLDNGDPGFHTAEDVAKGLNGNPVFVEYLLRNLDGEAMALQLNQNEAWITALVGALDGGALAGAVNNALATAGGQAFINDLLGNLNADIVSNALNANPRITEELLDAAAANGLGTTIGQAIVAAGAGGVGKFLTPLLGTLAANTVAAALNQALATHDHNMVIPDHNMLECIWLDIAGKALGILPIPMWINIAGFERAP